MVVGIFLLCELLILNENCIDLTVVEMEKKSQCIHAEQSSFSGLGELSSKANLNGVSKGLTSLVTEDVR